MRLKPTQCLSVMTLLVVIQMISIPRVLGCTAFVLEGPTRRLLCESFDWHSGQGLVAINKRGVTKRSIMAQVMEKTPLKWTSRYGSITFSWIGLSLPTCGMNSQGLAITALIDSKAVFAPPDQRPIISISQWKQYVLDNCKDVAQALTTLKKLHLSSLSRFGVHYLLADAGGQKAIVQLSKAGPRIYQGVDLPYAALTNSLNYGQVLHQYATNPSGLIDSPRDHLGRFGRAARMMDKARQSKAGDLMNLAWETFEAVWVPGYTRWNIVFDLQARQVWFRTDTHPAVRQVALDDLDLSCKPPVLTMSINSGMAHDILGQFQPWPQSRIHRTVLNEADHIIGLVPKAKQILDHYPENLVCAPHPVAP